MSCLAVLGKSWWPNIAILSAPLHTRGIVGGGRADPASLTELGLDSDSVPHLWPQPYICSWHCKERYSSPDFLSHSSLAGRVKAAASRTPQEHTQQGRLQATPLASTALVLMRCRREKRGCPTCEGLLDGHLWFTLGGQEWNASNVSMTKKHCSQNLRSPKVAEINSFFLLLSCLFWGLWSIHILGLLGQKLVCDIS